VERNSDIAQVDYAPAGVPPGDCVVDNEELLAMADGWLLGDSVTPTKNPNDVNLVLYYPMEEGDGNKIYPHPSGRLNDSNIWSGNMWNAAIEANAAFWSTDHAPGIGGSRCLYFDGAYGCRVDCGTIGQAALGIGPDGVNTITLSVWMKSLGSRTWDPYLASKYMGLLSKRNGWSQNGVIWIFSITPGGTTLVFGSRDGGVYSDDILAPFWGKWIHVAATYPHPSGDVNDANEYTRLYLNGEQIISGPEFHYTFGSDSNILLTIGNSISEAEWGNSPEGFYGYIDEVRIYDRVLEPNEIAYLADTTPEDGYLQIPPQSAAEVYAKEPVGQQIVNFKDYALVAKRWLEEDMYP
jgi:hypothetical protein